VQAN
jgi:hypothetical protein